jgi:hypothetical protein
MAAENDTLNPLDEPVDFRTSLDEVHASRQASPERAVLTVRRDASAQVLADLVHARLDWIRKAVSFASSAQSDHRPEDFADLLRPMVDEAHILSELLVSACSSGKRAD